MPLSVSKSQPLTHSSLLIPKPDSAVPPDLRELSDGTAAVYLVFAPFDMKAYYMPTAATRSADPARTTPRNTDI